MTTNADICNRALQTFGTRTDVTAAELAAASTNEAKQFNLIAGNLRDDLLRMAPWDCGLRTANLNYITSVVGTPENQSPVTPLWAPGQPPPPWQYEYQYPVDCLRAISIIPANQTGFSGNIPISPAVTGGASTWWMGQPVKFKIQTDQFIPVVSAAVVSGGTGHVAGDIITLPLGPVTSPPIGAPVQLQILTAPGGVIGTVGIISVVIDQSTTLPAGGSYFTTQSGTIPQGSTNGVGIGATFTLVQGPQADQRVILTNQEFATLQYVKRITDPNVMDTLFQTAWIKLCGAALQMGLRGDKGVSNMLIEEVNKAIQSARAIDGNEGLTINDVTPDWIRARGIAYSDGYMSGPFAGFDWGGMWPSYN